MNKVFITNRNEFICKYFTSLEFWSPAKHDFYISESLLKAADILRLYFLVPIIITSTSRPNDNFGFHRYDMACDFISRKKNIQELFKIEVLKWIGGSSSDLISKLREVGITGLGVEQVCIHLDIRTDHTSRKDQFGKYIAFEYKQDKDGNILINKKL